MIEPFRPREVFSPSSIEVFNDCQSKWGYAYLEGLRGPPTKAASLGTRIHVQRELHFWGEPMDLEGDPEACRRAIAGLHLFPDPNTATEIQIEGVSTSEFRWGDPLRPKKFPINFPTEKILGEKIEITGYIDLAMRFDRDWYLFDHKSCRTYDYQYTPEDLGSSLQGNIYSYALMSDSGTDLVPARWTYTRTEGSPDARYTDWTFERPATESNLKILLAPVLEMRNLVRLKIAGKISVEELTKTIESCTKYGGCPHHPRKGGPCKINTDLGLLVSQNLKKAQMETLAEKLKRKREAQQNPEPAAPVAKVSTLRIPTKTAAPAVKLPPRNPVSPPEAEEVMTVAIEEDDLPPVSGEVEDLGDTTPAPPPKRGRPKGTTTKVSAKEPAEVDNGAEKRYFLKEAAFAFAPTRTAEDPEVAALECAVFGQQLWEHIQGD